MKDKPKHSSASLGFGIARETIESPDRRGRTLSARKPKILIVDPDPALRRLM
jgi:hypothetical protein